MKIHILYNLSDLPSGGGNQFLKALKQYFQDSGLYVEQVSFADLILFNSHHHFDELIILKLKYPKKFFVQRIDGPMAVYRKVSFDYRDSLVALANKYVADATIFQSNWSREQNHKYGIVNFSNMDDVIINAPSPLIFNQINSRKNISRKIHLISTSWSSNINKGFDDYKWLDENLNFDKYKYTFIGNSSVTFKNIELLPPMGPEMLALYLKESDVFITASRFEACSNALLEALHCGKPAIAYRGSSNVEIVGNSGLLYSSVEEIPFLLDFLVHQYDSFKANIRLPSIFEVGDEYLLFFKKLFHHQVYSELNPKKIGLLHLFCLYFYHLTSKIYYLFKKF